jgi:hypothetical protein
VHVGCPNGSRILKLKLILLCLRQTLPTYGCPCSNFQFPTRRTVASGSVARACAAFRAQLDPMFALPWLATIAPPLCHRELRSS